MVIIWTNFPSTIRNCEPSTMIHSPIRGKSSMPGNSARRAGGLAIILIYRLFGTLNHRLLWIFLNSRRVLLLSSKWSSSANFRSENLAYWMVDAYRPQKTKSVNGNHFPECSSIEKNTLLVKKVNAFISRFEKTVDSALVFPPTAMIHFR